MRPSERTQNGGGPLRPLGGNRSPAARGAAGALTAARPVSLSGQQLHARGSRARCAGRTRLAGRLRGSVTQLVRLFGEVPVTKLLIARYLVCRIAAMPMDDTRRACGDAELEPGLCSRGLAVMSSGLAALIVPNVLPGITEVPGLPPAKPQALRGVSLLQKDFYEVKQSTETLPVSSTHWPRCCW